MSGAACGTHALRDQLLEGLRRVGQGCDALFPALDPLEAGGDGRQVPGGLEDGVGELDGQGNEQSSSDLSALSVGDVTDEEAEELRALSAAYRDKFNRPLVICADNVVDRKHLLESGWRRVEHSPAREARFALGEVIDIADLRFDQLVADANPMRAAWDAGVERF